MGGCNAASTLTNSNQKIKLILATNVEIMVSEIIVRQEIFDSSCSCQIFVLFTPHRLQSDISTATAVSQSHSHVLSMNDDENDPRGEVLNHTIGRDKYCSNKNPVY
uniref:Uncharacterized protein n=1 Tax=Glossina austeni TaxID=7395 RepID=A0A1A9UME0_GLOAU